MSVPTEPLTAIPKALREFVRRSRRTGADRKAEQAGIFRIVHEEYTDPFGIGPIANYVVRKELEARTLRILSPESAREDSFRCPNCFRTEVNDEQLKRTVCRR